MPPSTTTEAEEREIAEAARIARYEARAEFLVEAADIPARYWQYTIQTHFTDAKYERVRYWAGMMLPERPYTSEHPEYVAWEQYRRSGLYLYGGYGSGKTAAGCAVLRERTVWDLQGGLFLTTHDLLGRMKRAMDGEPDDVLAKAQDVAVLLLDDIGAERMTEWAQEQMFALINARYNAPSLETIFTSNLEPSDLAKHVGERIAWRIMEMCKSIKLTGNYRKTSTSA